MTSIFGEKKSQLGQKYLRPEMDSCLFKMTQVACKRKPLTVKDNYWYSKPNPGFTGFQSCQSIFNISVFVMSWHGKMIQGSKKLPLHWCSDGFNSLVSDHLDCFHNDLHYERYTMTSCSKSEFSLRCDGKKLMAQKSHKERNYRHSFFCET